MKGDRPVSYRLDPGAQVATYPFRDFDTLGPRSATFTPFPRSPAGGDGLNGELVLDGDNIPTIVRIAAESAWWRRWEEQGCA